MSLGLFMRRLFDDFGMGSVKLLNGRMYEQILWDRGQCRDPVARHGFCIALLCSDFRVKPQHQKRISPPKYEMDPLRGILKKEAQHAPIQILSGSMLNQVAADTL